MRLIGGLFLAAVVGVLTVLGIALGSLGWPVLTAYLVVVAAVVVTAGLRTRKEMRHRAAQAAGRTCSCCTSTVFDAVEVR